MLNWTTEAQGNYITLRATDGDYEFEIVGPYQKQPCRWSAYHQKRCIGSGDAGSVELAKFRAVSSKVDHIHGMVPYPD